ncbi:MAG: AraC family transcriptional regulator [Lachnospiraceae bacterium]|nr:AraC family transcriptional regulator [Lachnospiraceae bacterium]
MKETNTSETTLFSDIQVSFCSEGQWKPRQVFGPGSRLHHQLYAVLSGKGILQIGNEIYYLQPGDTVFILPGTRIYLEADEYTPWKLAWTAFSGEESGSYLRKTLYPSSPVYGLHARTEQLTQYFLHLVEVFERENSRPMEITGALLQLLSFLVPSPKASIRRADIKQYHLGRAKKYLEENYCYDIRIQDISHQLGIDRSYIYRLFMELEGKSPTDYLFEIRMKKACTMLEEEKNSVAETAYTCGFADPESLTYHFLQRLNMTPEDYRWTHVHRNILM